MAVAWRLHGGWGAGVLRVLRVDHINLDFPGHFGQPFLTAFVNFLGCRFRSFNGLFYRRL